MKIKINVKEEHIINGECMNKSGCAIALAVRDVIPEALINYFYLKTGSTDSENVIVNGGRMPKYACDKMHIFDNFRSGHVVGKARLEHLKPFSFVVDVDESILFPDKLLQEIEQIIEGSKNVELVTVLHLISPSESFRLEGDNEPSLISIMNSWDL